MLSKESKAGFSKEVLKMNWNKRMQREPVGETIQTKMGKKEK